MCRFVYCTTLGSVQLLVTYTMCPQIFEIQFSISWKLELPDVATYTSKGIYIPVDREPNKWNLYSHELTNACISVKKLRPIYALTLYRYC